MDVDSKDLGGGFGLLERVVSQYPMLTTLASYVSIDLFYLALTCRANHASILGSPTRETFTPEELRDGVWRSLENVHDAIPEVRLFNITRDEAGGLVAGTHHIRCLRPHILHKEHVWNVMALCETCDDKKEKELKGKFLNERCNCDAIRWWVCTSCAERQEDEDPTYRYWIGEFGAAYPTPYPPLPYPELVRQQESAVTEPDAAEPDVASP
ncbi:hypothetical protein B0T26DRAFT_745238 [Lasiosphaeria miniovina]|uniref:Uncharacterized protein n=1 Tax=Lasiosphaeria miniovina TaxID=1954250 RepID=A0AA40BF87_9PEZI|nr:uncharacterized protein B0T26DRAFT_745238 [Lasiosphaeria miniovina]KAK0733157.1 hypothetical protein B0T26DRAFT_745238 [Lasiosphaeria miniovina]